MEVGISNPFVEKLVYCDNTEKKTILEWAKDSGTELFESFKKYFDRAYTKNTYIDKYLNNVIEDGYLFAYRDKYFKYGFLLASDGKNQSHSSCFARIAFEEYQMNILEDVTLNSKKETFNYFQTLASVVNHMHQIRRGASFCILISLIEKFAKDENLEMQFKLPADFFENIPDKVDKDEYLTDYLQIARGTFETPFIPYKLVNALPDDLLKTISAYETQAILWEKVYAYFDDITLEQFAQPYLEKWSKEFEDSISKSFDRATFIKQQKRIHDFKNIDWTMASEQERKRNIGYQWAISGNSKSISTLLRTNEIRYHPHFDYSYRANELTSYKDLEMRMDLLNHFTQGFAHAMFLHKINNVYIPQYLRNGEKRGKEEELDTAKLEKISQKIALMHELGILDSILDLCTQPNNVANYNRAATIINAFTDINIETLRKGLEGIRENNKNNPLKNEQTQLIIKGLLVKWRIESRK